METKHMLTKFNEVDVDGIKLRMKISEEDFVDFKEKLIVETVQDFVARDQAYAWIDKNVLGGINKDLLDK